MFLLLLMILWSSNEEKGQNRSNSKFSLIGMVARLHAYETGGKSLLTTTEAYTRMIEVAVVKPPRFTVEAMGLGRRWW